MDYLNDSRKLYARRRSGFPAFPVLDNVGCVMYGGMTLRDYFAAKAMAVLVDIRNEDDRARAAYTQADAMLKARQV